MEIDKIKEIININLNGVPPSSYSWNASKINGSSYRINIYTSISLNEMSLSLTFLDPGLVIDSLGTIIEETTTEAALPSYDYLSEDMHKESESASAFSGVLSYIALAILLVLLFKGSYPLLLVF